LAIAPRDPETFYREVDEELRRDELSAFVQRYGIAVVGAVVLLLAALGGYLWWQNHKQAQAEQQAEAFVAVIDDIQAGRSKGVDGRLDSIAQNGNEGYRAAALLTKADLALQGGNDAAAAAAFKKVADDGDFAAPYRELALIRQTTVEYDKLPPAVVIQRLKPLAVQGNPWFGSAGEMVAMAYLTQRKPELAAPIFAALAKDENVPRTIRARSLEMASSLGVDAIGEKDAGAAPAARK
jgi:hypothetical protein